MVCAVPDAPLSRRAATQALGERRAETGSPTRTWRRTSAAFWSRVTPALALVALGPLAFHRALTPGWAIVDYDIVFWVQPYYSYLGAAWRQGRLLPLWNPHIYLGAPFLANIQAGVVYPPNLLLAFLPVTVAISWLIALHAGLAAAGMYAYTAMALRAGWGGGAVAGVVYMLNSLILSHVGEVNLFATLAWTPWLMLAADRVAAAPSARRVAALGATVALVMLAGHTQLAYFAFILALIAAGARLWGPLVRRRLWRRSARRVLLLASAVALGTALAVVQLTATVELLSSSVRSSGLGLAAAGSFSLPLHGVAFYLIGDYTAEHPSEFTASVGAAVLPLIALALVTRWRRPRVILWAALGAVAVLVAFGPKAGVYDAAYVLLPGFRFFRVPARALMFEIVAASILAAYGVQAAQQLAVARRRQRWRAKAARLLAGAGGLASLPVLAELATFLAGSPERGIFRAFLLVKIENIALMAGFEAAALAALTIGFFAHRAALAVLPAIVFCDLLLLNSHTFAMNPLPVQLLERTPATAQLIPHGLDERYLALVPAEGTMRVPPPPASVTGEDRAKYQAFAGKIEALTPNLSMRQGTLDSDGYDGGVLPVRSYVSFRRPLLAPGNQNPPDFTDRLLTGRVEDTGWLQAAAVTTVLAPDGVNPNPRDSSYLVSVGGVDGLTAWRNHEPPSRAHLESGTPARIVSDSGERVVVRLPPGANGRLILADTYFPGWKAEVDGRPAAIERYGGYTRAVSIPPQATEVVFEYRPGWLWPALIVNALALILAVTLALPSRLLSLRR